MHNEAFLACRGQLLRRVRVIDVDAQHHLVRAVFGSVRRNCRTSMSPSTSR
jgi:hypothetical protein